MGAYRYEIRLKIEFPDGKAAEVCYKALLPESKTPPTKRAVAEVRREGRHVQVLIKATDVTALRASINSYLRWIIAVKDLRGVVHGRRIHPSQTEGGLP